MKNEEFDLILVVGYFRSALPMLSVIKHLSATYKIGLICTPLDTNTSSKVGGAQKQFETLCIQEGAISLSHQTTCSCQLMVIQQYVYPREIIESLKSQVTAKEKIGMLTLASMGLPACDQFIHDFALTTLSVPDKNLAQFLIKNREQEAVYNSLELIEVGLPFKKYSVFEGQTNIDWIIAAPTLFSFKTELDKQQFLETTLCLLNRIHPKDIVVYKSHNGNVRDYFTPKSHTLIALILGIAKVQASWIKQLLKKSPRKLKPHLERILTAMLHREVTSRATPMPKVTKFADMPLEGFLPHVRKGVIGGLSNTIWGTCFFHLPYFNCIKNNNLIDSKSELLNKSGDALLGMNMKFFGVPFCEGVLDPKKPANEVAFSESRHNNLVDLIVHKLHKK